MRMNLLRALDKIKAMFDWEAKSFLQDGRILVEQTEQFKLYHEDRTQKRDFTSELKEWEK